LILNVDDAGDFMVLTSQEKRVIAFVVAAFLLGLGVKSYRETHRADTPIRQVKIGR
jgi:hypothetical protein